jgi:hypothetical protein
MVGTRFFADILMAEQALPGCPVESSPPVSPDHDPGTISDAETNSCDSGTTSSARTNNGYIQLYDQLVTSPETRFHAAYLFVRYFACMLGSPCPSPLEFKEFHDGLAMVVWDVAVGCLALSVKVGTIIPFRVWLGLSLMVLCSIIAIPSRLSTLCLLRISYFWLPMPWGMMTSKYAQFSRCALLFSLSAHIIDCTTRHSVSSLILPRKYSSASSR